MRASSKWKGPAKAGENRRGMASGDRATLIGESRANEIVVNV